jgi:hypothetical protein
MDAALVFAIAILAAFTGLAWWLPRRFGLAGMFSGHVLLVATYVSCVKLTEPEAPLAVLLLQSSLVNCALLPIALVALWRRRFVVGQKERRGFPVQPLPPPGRPPA